MTYGVAAVAASGVFTAAGWRSRQARGLTPACAGNHLLPDAPDADPAGAQPYTDAGSALRTALRHLAPVMANRAIQADVAAAFGLMVQMNRHALSDLLEDIITAAVNAAPVSRLLLTAAPHNGQVVIGVTDDMPHADLNLRRAALRTLTDRVATHGGVLHVSVRPHQGTTITLRLPAAASPQHCQPPQTQDLLPAVSFDMIR